MKVRHVVWLVVFAWLAAVLSLGGAGAFVQSAGSPPTAILLGVTLPIAFFLGAYLTFEPFRRLVLAADLRLLASLQAWRIGGFAFIDLYVYGVLPGLFAWPAGLGDMFVGLTAPWIARALMHDPDFAATRRYVAWNLLGILDLVVAVSLGGATSGFIPALSGTVTSAPMAQMPLVLIPAFFVPLFLILHLVGLFQARQRTRAQFGAADPVSA